MSRKISLCATAAALVLETLAASAEEPVLRIAKQGSMEAGGKTINCTTNDGGDANSTRLPPDRSARFRLCCMEYT